MGAIAQSKTDRELPRAVRTSRELQTAEGERESPGTGLMTQEDLQEGDSCSPSAQSLPSFVLSFPEIHLVKYYNISEWERCHSYRIKKE